MGRGDLRGDERSLSRRRKRRIVVGGFAIETNSFVRGETTLEDFRADTFALEDEITGDVAGSTSDFAGAWDVLSESVELVPAIVARAQPGPPVAKEVAEFVLACVLKRCTDEVDGAYLMLNGAAVTRDGDDLEGRLLAAVRTALGPRRPIAVSLDHHAYVTKRMIEAVDIVTAYRTCPHVDQRARGEQAATILAATLERRVRPVVRMAGRAMVTSVDVLDSSRDPFRRLMALCDTIEGKGALAAALFTVNPWLDVPELGWKSVVTTDGDLTAATQFAERIMDSAWAERHAFHEEPRLPIDQALAEALAGETASVLIDIGDATDRGSPGDSTELLRAAQRRTDDPAVLLSICDPAAARKAISAGPRATLSLEVGTGVPGSYNERTTIVGSVVATRDGAIRYTHPAASGVLDDAGLSALLRIGAGAVVVHSSPVLVVDPAIYDALGAETAKMRVIQAKSGVTARAGFAHLTDRTVIADTRGPTTANLSLLKYRRRPRPLFPFEHVEVDDESGAPAIPGKGTPSLREVAERAGVSKATASRALGNRKGVSADARARILRAAADLGYEPNRLAQSLSVGATMTIGYLVRDISSPALPPILLGAEEVLRSAGYAMLLTNSESRPELDAEYIRLLRQRRVDGLLLSLADDDFSGTHDELRRLAVPFVVIDRELPAELGASSVKIDHGGGLRAAIEHLIALGHRRIGFVGGPPRLRPTSAAVSILSEFSSSKRQTAVLVDCEEFSSEHGEAASMRLLSNAEAPTAIIAGNGQILLGIIRTLTASGLRVPEDVSVVSEDDLPYLEFMTPPIASVVRDQYAIGRAAAELLLRRLTGGEAETVVIPTSFIPRGSTASPAVTAPASDDGESRSAARRKRQPTPGS
jgi:LacI family transcriptional regulator